MIGILLEDIPPDSDDIGQSEAAGILLVQFQDLRRLPKLSIGVLVSSTSARQVLEGRLEHGDKRLHLACCEEMVVGTIEISDFMNDLAIDGEHIRVIGRVIKLHNDTRVFLSEDFVKAS